MMNKIYMFITGRTDGLSNMDIVYAKMKMGKAILITTAIGVVTAGVKKLFEKCKSKKEEETP